MRHIPVVKKATVFLQKKFPEVKFTAYKDKKGVFWYISVDDHDTYFGEEYRKWKQIVRKMHLKEVKVCFCYIPNFQKFSLKQKESGVNLYVIKTE